MGRLSTSGRNSAILRSWQSSQVYVRKMPSRLLSASVLLAGRSFMSKSMMTEHSVAEDPKARDGWLTRLPSDREE
jgi:hypothetical protein